MYSQCTVELGNAEFTQLLHGEGGSRISPTKETEEIGRRARR
jgi:hypothetical protein